MEDFSLLECLRIDPGKHRLIAATGGGGKTTLLYELAKELRERGYQAAVAATTHMYKEGKYGFTPIGVPGDGAKIAGLSPEQPGHLLGEYDVVLVEADGSHRLPFKVPAEYEPVLPEGVNLVIGVAGASAIGHTYREACHRYETAGKAFGYAPEERIQVSHMLKVLTSRNGQRKQVHCDYRYVINQADCLTRRQIEEFLEKGKEVEEFGCLISFYEKTWYDIAKMNIGER